MALIEEWGMFRQEIVAGAIGLVVLLITVIIWRRMEGIKTVKENLERQIENMKLYLTSQGKPLGIDLGIKDLAICSDKHKYKNINKSYKVKRLEKQLKRQQRSLLRKYENLKKLKKGEATQKANIRKQMLKVQRLYHRIDNIRTDYINKTILKIVKTKPSYITI